MWSWAVIPVESGATALLAVNNSYFWIVDPQSGVSRVSFEVSSIKQVEADSFSSLLFRILFDDGVTMVFRTFTETDCQEVCKTFLFHLLKTSVAASPPPTNCVALFEVEEVKPSLPISGKLFIGHDHIWTFGSAIIRYLKNVLSVACVTDSENKWKVKAVTVHFEDSNKFQFSASDSVMRHLLPLLVGRVALHRSLGAFASSQSNPLLSPDLPSSPLRVLRPVAEKTAVEPLPEKPSSFSASIKLPPAKAHNDGKPRKRETERASLPRAKMSKKTMKRYRKASPVAPAATRPRFRAGDETVLLQGRLSIDVANSRVFSEEVGPPSPDRRGHLTKKSVWRSRFFKLRRSPLSLHFYRSAAVVASPLGTIRLLKKGSSVRGVGRTAEFWVNGDGQSWLLKADETARCLEWLQMLTVALSKR